MPLTYKVIQNVEVGSGGTSQLTFNSIPSTYDDLVVIVSSRSTGNFNTGAVALGWQFNNTTANRSGYRWFTASGSPGGHDTATVVGIITGSQSPANAFSAFKMYIPDYKDTGRNKVFIADSVAPGTSTLFEIDRQCGFWNQQDAINRIDFTASGNTFAQYTTATLIGIKKS